MLFPTVPGQCQSTCSFECIMSNDKQPADSMQAARLQGTPSICRYYKYSGTCRYKTEQCKHQHVRQSLPDGSRNLPSVEERHWCLSGSSVSSDDEYLVDAEPWRFSLLSYNILADKYAKHYRSFLYDNVPSTYLDWHHRRTAIVAELAHLQPDIICLQEVDRYDDLEAEFEQLGYAGIFLQRDGGRRDGCATFWRTSLLKPALVRQLRYSQYDLKDNVALLVLFEPHSSEEASLQPADAATYGALQQQQVQPEMFNNAQLQQQELQEQQDQQQHKHDLLSQWLPRSWRSSSSSGHRHHKTHLTPAPGLHGSSGGSALYQLPSEVLGQCSRRWASNVGNSAKHNSILASSPVTSSSLFGRSSSGKCGRAKSSKGSKPASPAVENRRTDGDANHGAEHVQLAPEWHRCGLLVANTHIIFTPDKGEVKLGQARMLIQEAAQMAEWYLQQRQQIAVTAVASRKQHSSSSSHSSGAATAVPHGVATIIAGDFNAIPNSPMYKFLSQGRIDLHQVNRRSVSHMCSGTSAKGYRGFRRLQKRRSIDEQRRSLDEQRRSLEEQRRSLDQQQQQDVPASGASEQLAVNSSSNRQPGYAAASVAAGISGMTTASSYSFSANSISSSNLYASPASPTRSTSGSAGVSSSTAASTAGSAPLSKQYRWSDKEVRRAAGMSYNELVEASAGAAVANGAAASGTKFGLGSSGASSGAGSRPRSPTTKIARAAAAFGAHVAAGTGAAAASLAAAAAAESNEPLESVAGTAAAAAVATAVSSGEQPLVLRHDLRLKSSYQSVLGREPEYTSSHSLFMDTCDYVWYTESPLTAPAQMQLQQQQQEDEGETEWDSCSNRRSEQLSGSNGLDSSSRVDSGLVSYELKPVAVLLPPDGMLLPKGLPSRWLGSDHIALVADFELSLKRLAKKL